MVSENVRGIIKSPPDFPLLNYLGMKIFFDSVFVITIIVLIVINFKTMLLPNSITLPAFVIAVIARIFLAFFDVNTYQNQAFLFTSSPVPATIIDAVIGTITGIAMLWFINISWNKLRGVEIFGFGDIKMVGMIGAYLGILNIFGVLIAGIVLAICCFYVLKIIKSPIYQIPSGAIWGIPAILFSLINASQFIFN